MKLWRLFPVVLFVGVLAVATVGFATTQDIDERNNQFAAEGEGDVKDCDEIQVEYRQTTTPPVGHVTGLKLWYPAGNNQRNHCGGERAGIEVHNASHEVMCSGSAQLDPGTTGMAYTNIPCDPEIPNEGDDTDCTNNATNGCVKDIAHENIVITDLPPD